MSDLIYSASTKIFAFGLLLAFVLIILVAGLLGWASAEEGDQGFASPTAHSQLHAFYNDLYNPKKQVSCCHQRDCRPTSFRDAGDHMEIMINGKWQGIKDDEIIPKTAPDWGAHVCAGDPSSVDPLGRVYCVIIPPRS